MKRQEQCSLCISRLSGGFEEESIMVRIDTGSAIYTVDIGLAKFAQALTSRYVDGAILTITDRKRREEKP